MSDEGFPDGRRIARDVALRMEFLARTCSGNGSTDIAWMPDDIDAILAVTARNGETLDEIWDDCQDARLQLRLLSNARYRVVDGGRFEPELRLFACRMVRIARPEYASVIEPGERHARGEVADDELQACQEELRLRAWGARQGAVGDPLDWLPSYATGLSAEWAAENVVSAIVLDAAALRTRFRAAIGLDIPGPALASGDAVCSEVAAILSAFLAGYIGNPFRCPFHIELRGGPAGSPPAAPGASL